MRNIIRSTVALSLVALVTGFAIAGQARAKVQFAINVNGVTYISLNAQGPQSQLKGSGYLKIGKAVTYPMTVDSGTYTTATTSSSSSGGSSSGNSSSSNSGISGTVTVYGYIKKPGAKLKYMLVGDTSSGDSTLSVYTVTSTTTNGVTTLTTTEVNTDFTGTVSLKF